MAKTLKKSGQKIAKKWSRLSKKASAESKEHIKTKFIDRISHVRNVRLLVLEWSLLVGVIIFLAITQAFWYADSYADDTYVAGGAYTEGTIGKINSLNPLFATTSSEKTLSKLLFATLSATDYSGHTGLDLAESIHSDDSGKIWTIKLRHDLKWSDGEPITNEDVLYTVSIIQNSQVKTAYASNLAGVKASEDQGNLIFTLSSAYANFSSSLDIPILPSHILKGTSPEVLLEHSFSSAPITSGPFTYNATQVVGSDGEKIVYLNPSPNYYKGQPLLGSFIVHAYLKTDDLKTALRSGSITATAELLPSDGDEVRSNIINERQTTLGSGVYAFLNTASQIMTHPLRQAIRQGIDMNQLRSHINGEQALDYPLINTQIEIKDYPELPAIDQNAAKETIANLGIPEDYKIRIATVKTGRLPELAEDLASQLQSLGLKTEVQAFEPTQDFLLGTLRPRNYDILIYEIELGPDPDIFPYYHSTQATETGLNLSNWRNYLADDLILGARSSMNPEARTFKYRAFLEYWVEDVPAIGIYQTNLSYYVNKKVRTFSEDNRLIYPEDRFTDVSRWATEKASRNRTP